MRIAELQLWNFVSDASDGPSDAFRGLTRTHLNELLCGYPNLDALLTPRPSEHRAPVLLDNILQSATTGVGSRTVTHFNELAHLSIIEKHAKMYGSEVAALGSLTADERVQHLTSCHDIKLAARQGVSGPTAHSGSSGANSGDRAVQVGPNTQVGVERLLQQFQTREWNVEEAKLTTLLDTSPAG